MGIASIVVVLLDYMIRVLTFHQYDKQCNEDHFNIYIAHSSRKNQYSNTCRKPLQDPAWSDIHNPGLNGHLRKGAQLF
jgi:hypothetical protein